MRPARRVIGATVLALTISIGAATSSLAETTRFDSLYARAIDARKVGDFVAAEGFLREAVAVEPQRADALYLLGMMVAFRGRHDEALAILERAAAIAPNDLDIRLGLAKVTSWTERFAEASAMVDAVLAEIPDYAEAWNLKGRIAYYRAHYDAAEKAFARARELEPENVEAHLGGGDVAFATGDRDRAESLYRAAGDLAPDSIDVKRRMEKLAAEPEQSWRIDLSGTRSEFGRQTRKTWHSGTIRITHRIDPATSVFGAMEAENRFGHTDNTYRVGAFHQITPGLEFHAEAGATVAPRFRPRWDIAAGGSTRFLENGTVVGPSIAVFDTRQREYEGSAVTDLNPGLRQYFLDGRIWITGRWINSFDRTWKRSAGWSARVDAQVFDRLRLGGGWSDAPESDEGSSIETTSMTLGVLVGITPDIDMRVDYLREDRETSYIRKEISTGLSMRF